jgi:hypothetical protein
MPQEPLHKSGRRTGVGEVLEAMSAGKLAESQQRQEVNERLASLVPAIKTAAAADQALARHVSEIAREAGALAAEKDYVSAISLLSHANTLLVNGSKATISEAERVAATMLDIWDAARQEVAARIDSLQTACAQYDDDALRAVADADLLEDLDGPSQDLEWAIVSGTGIGNAIAEMKGAIQDDAEVEALDENPMGVPMSIATILLGALDQIASLRNGA